MNSLIHSSPLSVLEHYWGYAAFRPLQEEIIVSVLSGKDTLALLPTGGGKSVCFQVPALLMDGICLVVSPLIALMKDQVEHLQKRGIKAVGIFSGMHRREIDIALDNCAYGDVKFLYVSPERLKTEMFLARLPKMKIGLLAIDEAHCISQWGYDFRPPYLQLGELRELLPKVPVIALTATATTLVKSDIIEKLRFSAGHAVFQQSFARKNLSYSAELTEDKANRLLQILQRVPGTAIVYVRSRNRTAQVANWLQKKGLKAAHYNAGLTAEQRNKTQADWIQNRIRIMVATNAFGMGIDKPDVRLVVHLDLPETLEAYYQEAGRAGRDERYAYAVLLYGPADAEELREKVTEANPPIETLKRVYQALANYYQVAVGSGLLQNFPFNLEEFSKTFKLKAAEVHHSLRKLETEGLVQLNAAYSSPSKVMFTVEKLPLYEYQIQNPLHDKLIQYILRSQGGQVFAGFTRISELAIAKQLKIDEEAVRYQLEAMQRAGILVYQPQSNQPQLLFTTPRHDAANLPLNTQRLAHFGKLEKERAEAVINYATHTRRCRTQLLLEYFGEITDTSCRICDFCIAQRKAKREQNHSLPTEKVLQLLQQEECLPNQLLEKFQPSEKESVLQATRQLLDTGKLAYSEQGKLRLVG